MSYFPLRFYTPKYYAKGTGDLVPQFDVGGPYLHAAFPVADLSAIFDLRQQTGWIDAISSGYFS